MSRIRMTGSTDISIPTPPIGKATLFYNDLDRAYKVKLDDGSIIVLSLSPEYIQDVVGGFFQSSSTVNVTYNDIGNVISVDVVQSALDISLIPSIPSGNLTSTNVQSALNELQTHIDSINTNSTEQAQDAIGSAIAAGNQDGLSVTYNDPANSLSFANTDKGSSAITSHIASSDPHTQYLKESDNLLITPQIIKVKVSNAGVGEFTSLSLAVASILDSNTLTKPYIIELGAGVHSVNNPINLPSGVSVRGESINGTTVTPLNPAQHLFVMKAGCELSFMNLRGAIGSIGSGFAAIYCEDIGDFAQLHKLSIYNFDICIWNKAVLASSVLYVEYVDINGNYTFGVKNESASLFENKIHLESFYSFASSAIGCQHIFSTGVLSELIVKASGLEGGANNKAIVLENGGDVEINGVSIEYFLGTGVGLEILNIGVSPKIHISSFSMISNNTDILVSHPTTSGSISGSFNKNKVTINNSSPLTIFIDDPTNGGIAFNGPLSYSGNQWSNISNIGPLITSSSTLGIFNGGELSAGIGLSLNVAALDGYCRTGIFPADKTIYHQLPAQSMVLPDNTNSFIYINIDGTLVSNILSPDTISNILLGRVITIAGSIVFIEDSSLDSNHYSNKVDRVLREALGSIYNFGSLVSENIVPRKLDITAGEYYYSQKEYALLGGSALTWDAFYRSITAGIYTRIAGESVVSNLLYDDSSGTLAPIPAAQFAKHTLYVLGGYSEKYILVYSQSTHLTSSAAATAPLANPPSFISGAFSRVASIIVQQGAPNIIQILDERPRLGFSSSSTSGGITVHSALSGLGNNDHNQYLLRDGSNAMINPLNMGTNSIQNVGLVDGVTVSAHASRHLPNGLDPLTTAAPVTIGTANNIGIANSFSRSDHTHNHGNLAGGSTHAIATTTVNGYMSAVDKVKTDAIKTKSGIITGSSFIGAPRIFAVVFTTPMTSVNYCISIISTNARTFTYQSKTTSGFTINANSNTALTGEVSWIATPIGEL